MAGFENSSLLQWDNFANNVSQAFQGMRKRSELFDVTLTCSDSGGRTLQAHKVLLSASSQFFQQIFCQQISPSVNIKPFVYLKGVAFGDLSNMLDFVYNREVSVPKNSLKGFLSLADELQITGINRQSSPTSKPTSKPPKPTQNSQYTPFSHSTKKKGAIQRNSDSSSSHESSSSSADRHKFSELNLNKSVMHVKTPGTDQMRPASKKRKTGNEQSSTSDEGWTSPDKSDGNVPNNTKKEKAPKKPKLIEAQFESSSNENNLTCDTENSLQNSQDPSQINKVNPHSPGFSHILDETKNVKPKIGAVFGPVKPKMEVKPEPKLQPDEIEKDIATEPKPNPFVVTEPHQTTQKVETGMIDTAPRPVVGGISEEDLANGIAWPPKNGTMIATLYEDTFYLGKVSSKIAKDGSVRVDYMERYKHPKNKKGHLGTGDEYWVWPSKFDIYPTFQETVLGAYPHVEKVTNQGMAGLDEVYFLTNYQTVSRLANNSKSVLTGTIG